MDRDTRWERIEQVYHLLTTGESTYRFKTAEEAIHYFYQRNQFDEFIPPTGIGEPVSLQDKDALFFFNFRSDRARQLTRALIEDPFIPFIRRKTPRLQQFVTMTSYSQDLKTTVAYAPIYPKNTLGELIAQANLHQLRIAETEKYAHVTFFFNGGFDQVFENETRILIPSLRISTYDTQPSMSASKITDALIESIQSGTYDFIVCNFANADMVGHTGNFEASIKAIECLDACMNRVEHALSVQGGSLLITADHGNAEVMFDTLTNQPHTAHTTEPVPFLYIGNAPLQCTSSPHSLIDVAPTILKLLGLQQPQEMTGSSILV